MKPYNVLPKQLTSRFLQDEGLQQLLIKQDRKASRRHRNGYFFWKLEEGRIYFYRMTKTEKEESDKNLAAYLDALI